MEKFDELKYRLDLNEHIKTAISLSGLGLAIIGLLSFSKNNDLNLIGFIVLVLIVMIILMQLVLGGRQLAIDAKERGQYKARYKRQLENLKKHNRTLHRKSRKK